MKRDDALNLNILSSIQSLIDSNLASQLTCLYSSLCYSRFHLHSQRLMRKSGLAF